MFIIDLSHPIHTGMPVYPGDPPATITTSATHDRDGYQALGLTLTSHTGTHLDAPAHLIPGGRTLDSFPLSHFAGPAQVVDCRQLTGEIHRHHLESQLRPEAEFILLFTGWDRHWGSEGYYSGYPVLSNEAAAFLAGLPLKGVGVDTISVDPMHASRLHNHLALLAQEKLIIENLTRLDSLRGPLCQLFALPLPLRDADGAPARVGACQLRMTDDPS